MKGLELINASELSLEEMNEVNGGIVFLKVTGILDGQRGNTNVEFLWWDLY